MKELLERLLEENREMLHEIATTINSDYKTGYIQALLNTKSSLEYELNKLD
jgi:hypothetical protein